MNNDQDTATGVAIETAHGRTYFSDSTFLGVHEGHYVIEQDVTFSGEDFDYSGGRLVVSESDFDVTLTWDEFSQRILSFNYRLHRIPIADVVRLDAVAHEDTELTHRLDMALECAGLIDVE